MVAPWMTLRLPHWPIGSGEARATLRVCSNGTSGPAPNRSRRPGVYRGRSAYLTRRLNHCPRSPTELALAACAGSTPSFANSMGARPPAFATAAEYSPEVGHPNVGPLLDPLRTNWSRAVVLKLLDT